MKTSLPKFRQLQRERIYRTKPWLKSTGAKTAEGKEKSKMNALKTNLELYVLIKSINYFMNQQQEIFTVINNS